MLPNQQMFKFGTDLLNGCWAMGIQHCRPTCLLKEKQLDIYTIILLKSVGVSKLQVAIHAQSSREMSQTVRIDWKHILSRVRVSVRPSNFFIRKNTQNYREYWVARVNVNLNEAATSYCSPVTVDQSPATT